MAVIAVGMLGGLGACALFDRPAPAPVVVAPPPPAPTSLTEEAAAALKAAEESVAEARAKKSLWTKAVQALDKARAAAQVFDSPATLAHAKEVVALCTLSIEQLALPPVKW